MCANVEIVATGAGIDDPVRECFHVTQSLFVRTSIASCKEGAPKAGFVKPHSCLHELVMSFYSRFGINEELEVTCVSIPLGSKRR